MNLESNHSKVIVFPGNEEDLNKHYPKKQFQIECNNKFNQYENSRIKQESIRKTLLDESILSVIDTPVAGRKKRLQDAIDLLSGLHAEGRYDKSPDEIIDMLREKVLYNHLGVTRGKLDPIKLLPKQQKNGREMYLPVQLQTDVYKGHLTTRDTIQFALEYADVDTSTQTLDNLIQYAVEKPGGRRYTNLQATIDLLSGLHVEGRYDKSPDEIIDMLREKVLYNHLLHTRGKLDPIKLLPDHHRIFYLPAPLKTDVYKGFLTTRDTIQFAFEYAAVDTSTQTLDNLIQYAVEKPGGRVYTNLQATIDLLSELHAQGKYDKSPDEIRRDLYIKTLRYKGFIEGDQIRPEFVQLTPLRLPKSFDQYVPGYKSRSKLWNNTHQKLMMAYDLAINEGFTCEPVLTTEKHLGKMHEKYGMDGVTAWYYFNSTVNRDTFSSQSHEWIRSISMEEHGELD